MNIFGVNIVGLSLAEHTFDYVLDSNFFKQYGTETVSEGSLNANLVLNKHETFIEAVFTINGTVALVCDRSLENFDFPIHLKHKLVYKYGDEDKEISEEVLMIHRDTATLDVGQPMFEYIVLAIPMKKLHPKFINEEENDDEEGKIIYTSETKEDEEKIDPRWEALKKLK